MKLVVPYIGELQAPDARLLLLAEFLGIPCETVALERGPDKTRYLEQALPDQSSCCLVLNPHVMKAWVGSDGIPADLVSFLVSRFPHLLVHGLHVATFDSEMVAALSRGRLLSVDPIDEKDREYVIAKASEGVCEAFSGLSFGPVNPANDHVLPTSGSDTTVEQLISIGGRAFMALLKLERAEILFVASEDVADLSAEVADAPLAEYFSSFVPHAMALRYVAGDECWRPSNAHASIIIDDPLLRKSYGFLNFESLLRLAQQHNFHATIAFIPHNFRRNSSRITRMFQENAAHLSICFHGNDHTEAEFASTDLTLLDTLLRVAEDRMSRQEQVNGLRCDRVMVFPQGNFSTEAMRALKSHNFHAAVNTVPYPAEHPVRLKIGELAQPSVLRYGGFPLFIRKPIRQIQSHDIAFNLFFGRPVLIVEHHDVFRLPQSLVEIVAKINSMAPEIRWSNLATVVCNSTLSRTSPDGVHHVRPYACTVRISNDSGSVRCYSIEWGDSCDGVEIEQVLMDGAIYSGSRVEGSGLRLAVELDPGTSRTFSLLHRNVHANISKLGFRWNAQAFLRRRLSEVRDNYLSKNQDLLAAAKAFQQRFLRI
jgi:hypothetical protein